MSRKTIVYKTSGVIVPQDKKVQEYLDSNIIGESELKSGSKYFATEFKEGDEKKHSVVLLRSK